MRIDRRPTTVTSDDDRAIKKTDEEWREQLSAEEYQVAREAGTERAFTGRYWNTKTPGLYRCVCCKAPLFRSETKYDSGSGWPSFYEPIDPDAVKEESDASLGMVRVEILCSRCDAHLGHVFPDGPEPTGNRYCMNSLSLDLEPDSGGGSGEER
jgi:peptide-methionine (R)-S-oxide reductase